MGVHLHRDWTAENQQEWKPVGVGELTGRFSVLLCSGDTTPWFHLLHRLTPETVCGVDGPFAAYTLSGGGVSVTFGTESGGELFTKLSLDPVVGGELEGGAESH